MILLLFDGNATEKVESCEEYDGFSRLLGAYSVISKLDGGQDGVVSEPLR